MLRGENVPGEWLWGVREAAGLEVGGVVSLAEEEGCGRSL